MASFGALRRRIGLSASILSLLLGGVLAGSTPVGAESRSDTSVAKPGVRIRSSKPGEKVQIDVGSGSIEIRTDPDDDNDRHKRVDIRGPVIIVDDGDAGLVRVFADAKVGPNEHIDGDVVAIFGSVEVEGRVDGDVVAVLGSVDLKPTAVVDGDVVAIGGLLNQRTGAEVGGQVVSLGILSWAPSLPTIPALIAIVLATWLVGLLFGSLLLAIIPERMHRVSGTAATRTGASLLLGIASAPLVVILAVLLVITVVGIPFAALLPFAYVFSVWAGQLAAAQVIGARLLRRPLEAANPYLSMALGTLFVAAFFVLATVLSGPPGLSRTAALFFTMLGTLVMIGLWAVGVGAVLLSRFGEAPKPLQEAGAPGGTASVQPNMPPIAG